MTMVYEWKTGYCEYLFEDPSDQQGQVKVTTLHWNCSAHDDAYTGYAPVTSIGTVDASEQNRVYTLAALQNVPESVMTGWVQQAMNNGEPTVQDVEDALLEQWNNQLEPPGGGITPS